MRSLVIAPHPDDEVLGCGGTLLRRKAEGAKLGWLIVTGITEQTGWSAEQVQRRDSEIVKVAELVGFDEVYNLHLPTTQLDKVPMRDLVEQLSAVFKKFEPEEVFSPHGHDVHTDHHAVALATAACVKWFRHPSVRRVLAYETLSESDFGLGADSAFYPNYFVNINGYLDRKIEAMAIYQSELGDFPFPRSVETVRALAKVRGSTSGFIAAEAFQLLRDRQ